MPPAMRIAARKSHYLLLALSLLACSGCEMDPAVTVHLEISGISDDADREDIHETLEGMTDGSGHMYSSSYAGDTMYINLSPVSDVEAFSKKINFGTVTEVDAATRTVKVDFVQ